MATEFESQSTNHERWMREALSLAQQAAEADEVPVGAIVVHNGEIIGRGFNQPIRSCDATAHAEIVAIRSASQFRNNYRLPGTTVYVTIDGVLAEECSSLMQSFFRNKRKAN
jgi:tRNA(adenine34) deaminase